MVPLRSNLVWVLAVGVLLTLVTIAPASAQTSPFSEAVAAVIKHMEGLAAAVSDPQALEAWWSAQFGDPQRRALWGSLVIHIAAAIAGGWALAFLTRLALGPGIRRIERGKAHLWWVRVPMAAGRFLLVTVPILVFAAAAAGVLAVFDPVELVRQAAMAVAISVAIAWLGVALARAVLAPLVPTLRPVPLTDHHAVYLFVWARRLINFLVFSIAMVEISGLMGLPSAGTLMLTKALGLILGLLVVVIALQSRKAVAHWIEGEKAGPIAWRLFRERLGDIWHVAAILYIASAWAVWALEVPGGFDFFAGNSAATAAIIGLAWVAAWASGRSLSWLFGTGKQIRRRYPFVTERANLYLPLVRRVVTALIQFIAALALLRIWGLDLWSWASSDLGQNLAARGISILVILGVAMLTWEIASAAIRIYLERTDNEGATLVRSKRVRTLLPLIRNLLMVVIGVMTGMVILSELGVSIGPLLAGAGVAGVAVGFGAQTLVKDFITGLFILFEDSLNVGDVVRVAGKIGTVEALTVRTVRLRDLGGVVHTVPFSSVDTIENLTKEFSHAVVDIGVGYRENYDRVVEVLTSIGAELHADPEFGKKILEPMSVLGLNELAESAVVIRVRFKTGPADQWAVKRDFLRRVKARFDELGIEIPFPHRTLYFGEDRQGNAPPLRHRAAPDTTD